MNNLKAISEIVIEKNLRQERIDFLISRFELNNLKEIKAKYLLEAKRKLVLAWRATIEFSF